MAERRGNLVYFERWMDPIAEERIGAAPGIALTRLTYDGDPAATRAVLAEAHGYQIAPRGELPDPWLGNSALIGACPHLLAICSTGAGFDMVDTDACTAAGIIVCNQSGSNVEAVAEHALGMMLALSKKIAQSDKALRSGRKVDRFALAGNDIFGKTLGIVGIGRIGTRVAELCRGLFGMTVLACDPYLSEAEIAARGATKVGLDEVLGRSDFVSVHCPRNDETMGMLGAREFALMKRSAYFVITARGGIYGEAALAAALAEGRIAGAGLDVFVTEPPPHDHPLLAFDNVIASPHNAGITDEAMRTMAEAAASQWIEIFAGRRPPRLVNPDAWPRYVERFAQRFGFRPGEERSTAG